MTPQSTPGTATPMVRFIANDAARAQVANEMEAEYKRDGRECMGNYD
jgi:hypothetical protein